MDIKIIKFDDTEIEKYKFHQHKSPFSIDNTDINKIVVPIKVFFDNKEFTADRIYCCFFIFI